MKLFEIEQDIKTDILQNCTEILSIYKETSPNFLYHGTTSQPDNYLKIPKQNRTPTDTPEIVQEIVDEFLKEKNFKALRSNSIFTSTAILQAKSYGSGNFFYTFPIDGFNYTWFEETDDLYRAIGDELPFNINDLDYTDYEELEDNEQINLKENILEAISKAKPKNTGLEELLKSGSSHEVMIDSPCYILTNEEFKKLGLL